MKPIFLLIISLYSSFLFAQNPPVLLKDIRPGVENSVSLFKPIIYQGDLYFAAAHLDTFEYPVGTITQQNETRLYKSDGTEGGTNQLVDLNPNGFDRILDITSIGDTKAQTFFEFNDLLYFSGSDGTTYLSEAVGFGGDTFRLHYGQLCSTNGTAASTELVETYPDTSLLQHGYNPYHFIGAVSSSEMLFIKYHQCSDDPSFRLYTYNDQTSQVNAFGEEYCYYIPASEYDYDPFWLNDTLLVMPRPTYILDPHPLHVGIGLPSGYFTSTVAFNTQQNKIESLVGDFKMGGKINEDAFVSLGPEHPDLVDSIEVALSTASGNVILKKLPSPVNSYNTQFLTDSLDGYYYFTVVYSESPDSSALWRTNGTQAGTEKIKSIAGYSYGSAKRLQGDLFFHIRDDATGNQQLWKTNGTQVGTQKLTDLNNLQLENAVVFDYRLFFVGGDAVNGSEVWSTDGTPAGTQIYHDLYPGSTSGVVGETKFIEYENKLFFDGVHPSYGKEIFYIESRFPASVQNPKPKSQYLIAYPNPTTGEFSVNIAQNTEYQLYNSVGELIAQGTIHLHDNHITDLINAPTGLYWIRLDSHIIKLIKK